MTKKEKQRKHKIDKLFDRSSIKIMKSMLEEVHKIHNLLIGYGFIEEESRDIIMNMIKGRLLFETKIKLMPTKGIED